MPVLRKLLGRAGMRFLAVYSTDEGSRLRRLRSEDPIPLAVATAEI